MKHTLILIITLLAIVSCKNAPTTPPPPPPPAPYTDHEICRMYVMRLITDGLAEPESLEVMEEKADSVDAHIVNSYDEEFGEKTMLHHFDIDYRYRNEYGAYTRREVHCVCKAHEFCDLNDNEWIAGSTMYLPVMRHYHFEPSYANFMQKVHLADSIRTAKWNAYQDSIQSTKTH